MVVMSEIEQLKNIGPKTGTHLREVDIISYDILASLGAETSFQRVYFRFRDEMKFTSVYLYALEGAIDGVHWNEITLQRKEELQAYFKKLTSVSSI